MIDECMVNSYRVMTLKSTVDEILSKNKKAMFYGDPFDYTNEDIDEVIKYFENTEEYEKCDELLNEKNAKNTAEFDIFLDNLAENNGITNY